jgi:hypothetical protein
VLLAISTAALLTAVFWLGLELAQYHWDIKAKTRPLVGAAFQEGSEAVNLSEASS